MAKEEKNLNELSEEEVGNVSGGYLMETGLSGEHDSNSPIYCALDSEGNVLKWFDVKQEAMEYARENNISDYQLSEDQLVALRNGEKLKFDPIKEDKKKSRTRVVVISPMYDGFKLLAYPFKKLFGKKPTDKD